MQNITYKYTKLFENTKADEQLKIRKFIGRFALVWHKWAITLFIWDESDQIWK